MRRDLLLCCVLRELPVQIQVPLLLLLLGGCVSCRRRQRRQLLLRVLLLLLLLCCCDDVLEAGWVADHVQQVLCNSYACRQGEEAGKISV
jgi:hypothetical protein